MELQQWLGEDNELGKDIFKGKYQYDSETFEQFLDRVSNGDQKLRKLIKEKKFLLGGRALSNRGLNNGSYFNCYSSGFCPDDFKGIMDLNTNLGLTYKAQGGQGVSLSKLRPKGTPIGKRYTSDGILPFLELFNKTTEITSQAGSRKGALLVSLDIRHKEAEDFIKIKSAENSISKANLSLEIDDKFMKCVETYYKTGEEITLHEYREYTGHIVEYDIIPIKLYKLMMQCAYDWAEPGCIFSDPFRNYNLMEMDDDYQVETCNPCGEQPLAKNFCCNLGSINLSEFVLDEYTDNARIDYHAFGDAVVIAINALDVLVDENLPNHPLQEQRDNSENYRNIGLGLMGIGTTLFKLKLKYGSMESKEFVDKLFSFMFKKAILASSDLAFQKGPFPKYKECVFDSQIIKNHFNTHERDTLKATGLRNCSLLSIAPTGSIGTMIGVTGGCEPEFAIKYTRKTDNLKESYDMYCNEAKYYMNKFNTKVLPDYFVCASDIKWQDRLDMQAVMQQHIDTAISSTVNLPNDITLEEVEHLYLYAWQARLKGITIYRDGCKRSGVLITTKTKPNEEPEVHIQNYDHIQPVSRTSIGKTYGSTDKLNTACGSLYLTINRDKKDGNIVETFASTSKNGTCKSNIDGMNRLISLSLRSGVKVGEIIDQLKGITCPACIRVKTKGEKELSGLSCPDMIAKALELEYNDKSINIVTASSSPIPSASNNGNTCPECNTPLENSGGCVQCLGCGWSKCS